jgi:hypothetical protein
MVEGVAFGHAVRLQLLGHHPEVRKLGPLFRTSSRGLRGSIIMRHGTVILVEPKGSLRPAGLRDSPFHGIVGWVKPHGRAFVTDRLFEHALNALVLWPIEMNSLRVFPGSQC